MLSVGQVISLGQAGLPYELAESNGEGGIRTPVGCDPKLDFESSAFNRSATSPGGSFPILQS